MASGDRETASRMDTLLNLVELLLQERGISKASDQDDALVSSIDEDHQAIAGVQTFTELERSINTLDKEFRNFANAARQLGGSIAIIAYGIRIRGRLAQLLFVYRENTADLFPRRISRCPIPEDLAILEIEGGLFDAIANDIGGFLKYLNEFAEFEDEDINMSILPFEGDLRYWSSSLDDYRGQFRTPAVQRYIHDLSQDLGKHIDSISASLSQFTEVAIPTVKFTQDRKFAALQNVAMVATFLSSVSATTLGLSFGLDQTQLGIIVTNTCWIVSLGLSIGSAFNSITTIIWKQAVYRGPVDRFSPWIGVVWIEHSPMLLLVLSIIAFLLGLSFLTFSLQHRYVAFILNAITTAFVYGFFLLISIWFITEQQAMALKGQKLFGHYWQGGGADIYKTTPSRSAEGGVPSSSKPRFWTKFIPNIGIKATSSQLPISHTRNSEYYPLAAGAASKFTSSTNVNQAASSSSLPTGSGKILWEKAREALMHPNSKRKAESIREKLAWSATKQTLAGHSALARHLQFSPVGRYLAVSSWDRTTAIHLAGEGGQLGAHRVLQQGETVELVDQVAWSPKGDLLLTRSRETVKVWAVEDAICRRNIKTSVPVTTVTWMPDGESFLTVASNDESSDVTRISVAGQVLDYYDFPSVRLHDIAVTPDSLRIVGAGLLLGSPSGLQPLKYRAQKRLVAYNIQTQRIESQTPLLNEVRAITIAQGKGGVVALISYEDMAPPQLWNVEVAHDTRSGFIIARLSLERTFMPKNPVTWAGSSYFGGKNSEFVICGEKDGDIHIWSQESGVLLNTIRAKVYGGDRVCVAWNPAAEDPYMFVTRSYDGGVRVWSGRRTHELGTPSTKLEN